VVLGRIGFSEVKAGGSQVEEFRVRKLSIEDKLFQVRDSGGMDKQMRGQDSDILVVERAVIVVRAVWEVVRLVSGPRLIDKFKIEFCHFREVVGNTAANFLGMAIIFQVRVVREDANLMRGSNQEMAPSE
jgi:hypothetical protein